MGSWVTAVWRKANPGLVLVSVGVVGVVLALACSGAGGEKGSVEGDRVALTALYDATDGANWNSSDNWLSDRPLGEWGGVGADDSGRVTVLELSFNRLKGDLPRELGKLSKLEKLHLSRNALTGEIPAELGKLSNLGRLDLYDNLLTGEIPVEIGKLSNLEELDLSRNELTGEIPAELGQLSNLGSLDLEGNALTGEIPAELGQLSNLGRMFISDGNEFTGCVPDGLRDVFSSDFARLGLPFCESR